MDAKRVSVVIPAHHEGDVIGMTVSTVVSVMQALAMDFEVIVVDDGSRDGTFETVAQLHNQFRGVKAVRLSRQFGKEAAMLAGLAHARGDAVVTIDGDLQHPPELIPEMVAAWQAGAHIVHGVKKTRLYGGRFHRTAARIFNTVFSRVAGFDIVGSSDFKLLDARVARLLVERFPEHGRFHRGLSTWVGFNQVTIPFEVRERIGGQSRWRLSALFNYAWNTLTAYSSLPLKLVPIMGAVMLIVSLVLGVEAVLSRVLGRSVSGFATLEITILFTGSMIMIGLGIIGQYLARMYDELKQRPLYLVADQIGFEPAEKQRSTNETNAALLAGDTVNRRG